MTTPTQLSDVQMRNATKKKKKKKKSLLRVPFNLPRGLGHVKFIEEHFTELPFKIC